MLSTKDNLIKKILAHMRGHVAKKITIIKINSLSPCNGQNIGFSIKLKRNFTTVKRS